MTKIFTAQPRAKKRMQSDQNARYARTLPLMLDVRRQDNVL